MWPFSCKSCKELKAVNEKFKEVNRVATSTLNNAVKKLKHAESLAQLSWHLLSDTPPINTNLLVANKDFSYFGFLYMDDGWDNARRINMQGKEKVWPTYTNTESIAWWLNLDEIKR